MDHGQGVGVEGPHRGGEVAILLGDRRGGTRRPGQSGRAQHHGDHDAPLLTARRGYQGPEFDTPSNEQGRAVATVEQHPATNGSRHRRAGEIAVENPATGEVIAHVPDLAPREVAAHGRARRAPRSPAGRRSASRAAPASCCARRSGSSTTPTASSQTIVSETGKTYEDAQHRRDHPTAPTRSASGPSTRREYLADEQVKSAAVAASRARSSSLRYRPLGLVGVIGPWNYPLTNSFGDCIPALAAGNSVILKPSRDHAADLAAARRGPARVRPARRRLPGRHRPRRDRRRAGRRGRHDHVHRLDAHRQEGHGARRPRR